MHINTCKCHTMAQKSASDHLQVFYHSYTVPLNYNFIFTRVDMHGATQYFACEMPKFPMEILISTRQDVVSPRDDTWYLHETWHVAITRNRIVKFTRNVVVLTKLNNLQDSSRL